MPKERVHENGYTRTGAGSTRDTRQNQVQAGSRPGFDTAKDHRLLNHPPLETGVICQKWRDNEKSLASPAAEPFGYDIPCGDDIPYGYDVLREANLLGGLR